MGLPEGWVEANIGAIIELKYGKSLPSKKRTGNGHPVYGSNGIVGYHESFLVGTSGLIVGRKGSSGVVNRSEQPFFPIDTTYYVDEFHGQPLGYWYNFLRYLPLREMNRSTAIPGLNREDAYKIRLSLPPLNEQIRIANKLDSLLAKVETAQNRLGKIPVLLKRFRQSVLAAATSGELTREWRDTPEQVQPKEADFDSLWEQKYKEEGRVFKKSKIIYSDDEIEDLPETWLSTRLGVLCDVYVGSTPSRKVPEYWDGDINWVSSAEVAFCYISSTKEKITGSGLLNTSTRVHPASTVLLAMIGQGKTRGQAAILTESACHNQNTAALRVLPECLMSEYLYQFLWSRYEETRKVGGGNNQKALNKTTVQGLAFPLPPLEEQAEIVRRVESLFAQADKVEAQYKATKTRLDKLTQSILAKAFRGELVPQDPNDEPASELLKRIQTERGLQVKTKPKRARKKSAVSS